VSLICSKKQIHKWRRTCNFLNITGQNFDKYFQLSPLGSLASWRIWRRLATNVWTTKNLPKLQRVISVNFSWLRFSSCLTGLSYKLMDEPSISASDVSTAYTTQIGYSSSANTRNSELCARYVYTYNQKR